MILLIRHTTPVVPKGTCYGQADVELADSYAAELAVVRAALPTGIEVCYTSPLSRCVRLANDLFPGKVTADARLKELNFGEWELLRWEDLGQAGIDWGNNFVTYRPPGGETVLELQQRVLEFWQHFVAEEDNRPRAIVTHAGVMRVILAHQKSLPIEQAYSISVDYGQIISLDAV